MITEIKLREHNKKFYLDLLKDMSKRKNGLFTFVIRVSSGFIVDCVTLDNFSPNAPVDIYEVYEPESAQVSGEDRDTISEG